MRLSTALLLSSLALLAGCGSCDDPSEAPPGNRVGDFLVDVTAGGVRVAPASDPGRVLLESFAAGPAPYSPVATRRASATWEEMYGAFKVTENDAPWRGGAAREGAAAAAGPVEFVDETGTVATLEASAPAAGVLKLVWKTASTKTNRISVSFACAPDDRFVGFGGQADALDHRGHKIPIWTSEPGIGKSTSDDPPDLWMVEGTRHGSSYGLPTWLSQRGYLAVLQSDQRSLFELCSAREDAFRVETWGGELALWIHDGPAPAQALERATAGLLGRPPRPPALAFAPWNDAIFGAENVRAVARLIRERGIPSSAIWTEDFRGGYESGKYYRLKEEWELDPALYPDPKAFAAELNRQGFAWFAYFNTFLVQGTKIAAEALAGGHYVQAPKGGAPYIFNGVTFEPTGLADLSRPETREWVKSYLRKALDQGFDGWMADFGEWLPHDAVLSSGEDPMEAHNRYALEWVRLNQEVLAERASDGRERLFFARAGWLGSNALAPVYWAGDQRTDFQPDDGMPTVVTLGVNLGLAGISTYGHDIGGYQTGTNPPTTKEVFFRWTSLGALSPVMRTHHTTEPKASWWFGKDEETLEHFKRWASFHIRLFPYLDGGSAVAERTGLPLMRALLLEFPEWAPAWQLTDEYLLGPALLVAPVMEAGKTSRKVQLPPGRWLPLEGEGGPLDGPAQVEARAEVTEIPVFVRAGSVVPLLPEGVQSLLPAEPPVTDLQDVADRRELLVALGAEGSFTERDGTVYRLVPSTSGGYSQAGTALTACTSAEARGCIAEQAAGWDRLRLSGNGPVELGGWRLEIEGPARTLDLRVRR